jgi:DNA polymerase IV
MPGFCRDCLADTPDGAMRLSLAHIDCDAFCATVKKRDRPALCERPVIGGGGTRGVVAAACYSHAASAFARPWRCSRRAAYARMP